MTTQDEAPKWEHGTFGSLSRVRDGHREYLTAAGANDLEQRIRDLEARAAAMRAIIRGSLRAAMPGAVDANIELAIDDTIAQMIALPSTTKEEQA